MNRLFTYGTLQIPEVQLRVFGREVDHMEDDILPDYVLSEVVINANTYPIAVPSPGSSVAGTVMEVTNGELTLMDRYETEAYKRLLVTLGSGLESWVYVQPQESPAV